MKKQNIDLTQGVISRQLLLFFLPILAGSLFQQLYTTADAVIVGQFAGKAGLAAIDSVYNLLKLPVNFFVGLSTGATIIISQYFGAKNRADLSKAVHTAVSFAFLGGLLLSIGGVALAPYGLRMMEVPEEIFALTLSYVRIYFGGLAVSMLYNIGAGILRAMGDSKTPFYYLIVSSAVNVALDLLFVGAWGLGVAGAALATVIAQLVSAVLVIRALIKTDMDCRLVPRQLGLAPPMLRQIIVVGLPIGLQSSLYPIANMLIQASINSTGTDNIAAWALCGKLDFLIFLVADSLAAAVSTFAAQNYGAGQYKRLRQGLGIGLGITVGLIGAVSGLLYFWSEPLGRLFIKQEDYGIIPITGELMRFLAPLYFAYAIGPVLSGAIRGTGETLRPMLITLFGTCACRVLWILLVVPRSPSMLSIIASYPASWLVTGISFVVYYHYFQKKQLGSAPLKV